MAQRRLNKNLVVGLVLGLMVIVTATVIGLLVFVQGQSQDATPHVRRAVEAYRDGKLEAAAKAYGQAYERTKESVWLVAQGQVAKDMGDNGAALGLWERAISESPGLIPAHVARIKLRLEFVGNRASAHQNMALRAAAEALQRQSPDHPLAHFGLGIALTGMVEERPENMEEGIKHIEKAHELSPSDEEISASLATVYEVTANNRRRDKKLEEAASYRKKAEDVFREMIEADPESGAAYLAFAHFLMGRFSVDFRMALAEGKKPSESEKAADLKEVAKYLDKAEQLDPKNPKTGMHRAHYWRLSGDQDKVIESLKKVVATVPSHLVACIELANRHRVRSEIEEALKVLNVGLSQKIDRIGDKGESNKRLRFRMLCLACEIKLGQAQANPDKKTECLRQAEEFYNQAVAERGAKNWLIRYAEGQLREAQGLYRDAQSAYEEANKQLDWQRARSQKVRITLRLAQLYMNRLNARGQAVKYLDSILERSRDNIAARLLRAEAYIKMGKPNEGIDDAKRVLVAAKDLGDDHRIIKDARLLAMQGYSLLGQMDQVRQLQAKIGGKTPQDRFRQAIVYQIEKKNDKAAAAFKEVLKDDPANSLFLLRAVRFFVSIDKRDEAHKLLKAAQDKKPDDPALKQLGLILDDKLSNEERAKRTLELIKGIKDELSREVALYQYYHRRNKVEEAIKSLTAVRKLKPDDPTLLEREFTIALRQLDWKRAEKCWREAVQMEADGVGGRLYQGRIALVRAEIAKSEAARFRGKDAAKFRGQQEQAKKHFAEAGKLFREAVGIYDKSAIAYSWLGAAEEGLDNLVEARDAYTIAAELDPTNIVARRSLAKMGMTYGNVGGVEEHLKEAIRLSKKDREGLPLDSWLRLQVENKREQSDPRSAIDRREKLRKKNPKNIYNLMRLALLYERVAGFDKADKCVDDALKTEPNNLALARDSSSYFRRRKQEDKAEKLLRKLAKEAKGDDKAQVQRMVARHFHAVVLQLRTVKPFPKEQYLEALEKADRAYAVAAELPNASATVFAEAAVFYQGTRRYQGAIKWYRKALAVAKDDTYESQVRRRLIRMLLLQQPVPADAKTEIAQYVKRFPDDPVGLLFLGEWFAARGKLAEAIEEHTAYLDQIGRQDKSPSRSARMAEGYYLRGQLYLKRARSSHSNHSELIRLAIRDLERAKAVVSKDFRNASHRVLLARAHEMSNHPERAVSELRAVLDEKPGASVAARELVRLYARQKKNAEQESLIRQQMNLFPKKWYWPYVLGGQLERRDRASEAAVSFRKACEMIQYRVAPGGGTNQPVVSLLRVLDKTNQSKQIIDIVKGKLLKPEAHTSDVLAYYAGALAKTGKASEALATLKKAVASSRSFRAYSRVVQVVGKAFGLDKAVKLLREDHAKQGGKDAVSAMVLSSLLAYQNQWKDALVSATQAVAVAKNDGIKAICLSGQGILLYREGQKDKAAQAYDEALRIRDGGDLTVLNNLAFTLAEDMKRPKDALPYAERAAQLAPNDANVLDTLGWCLFLAGRTQDALGILQKTIDRDPELLDAHLHLATVYAKDGQKSEADGILRNVQKRAEDEGNDADKARIQKVMKELGTQG